MITTTIKIYFYGCSLYNNQKQNKTVGCMLEINFL